MQLRGIAAILVVAGLVGTGLAVALVAQPGADDPASDGGAARINACDMISAAQVQRVIGVAVRSGDRRDDGVTRDGAYSSTCYWGTSEVPEEGGTYAILNAMFWPEGSDGPKHFLESFHEAAAEHVIPNEPEPLPYGDQSLYWGDGVAVAIGDVSFGISVRHSSPDKSIRRIMEEMLAKQILENNF